MVRMMTLNFCRTCWESTHVSKLLFRIFFSIFCKSWFLCNVNKMLNTECSNTFTHASSIYVSNSFKDEYEKLKMVSYYYQSIDFQVCRSWVTGLLGQMWALLLAKCSTALSTEESCRRCPQVNEYSLLQRPLARVPESSCEPDTEAAMQCYGSIWRLMSVTLLGLSNRRNERQLWKRSGCTTSCSHPAKGRNEMISTLRASNLPMRKTLKFARK